MAREGGKGRRYELCVMGNPVKERDHLGGPGVIWAENLVDP